MMDTTYLLVVYKYECMYAHISVFERKVVESVRQY